MFGYIYETKNLINGKKYIGQHKARKFEGNKYLGSGTKLVEAIKNYGRDNFSIRPLKICESLEELEYWEIYYIQKYEAVISPNYYNIAEGGHAGGGHVIPSDEARKKMSESAKKRGNCLTEEGKLRCRHVGQDNGFFNKSHSIETIEHLREIHIGRIWINNGNENLHIHREELPKYLLLRYKKGMKPKHQDTSGRIWIHNPYSGKRKMIFPYELDTYKDWKLGVGRRNSSKSSETIENKG